ncbi:MAG: hypothetical protein DBX59_09105 [Bacillota bacterium]|nr:MAG: hypothetical protein DBX59_09105 [Bacillota bacterium]
MPTTTVFFITASFCERFYCNTFRRFWQVICVSCENPDNVCPFFANYRKNLAFSAGLRYNN